MEGDTLKKLTIGIWVFVIIASIVILVLFHK